MICGDHPAQLDELLLPLAWIAEARNAMTELPERELRIVLDVKVQIDQTRKDRTAGQVDGFSARRRRDRIARPDRHEAIALNDDAAMLDWRRAGAIDDAGIVEDQEARLRLRIRVEFRRGRPLDAARRQNRQHSRNSGSENHPTKRVAHRHGL